MKIIITEDQLKSLMFGETFDYYVKSSDTHGKGVFAKNDIKKGSEEIGLVIESQENNTFLYTDLGRYVNHNTHSNLEIKKEGNKIYFVAIKNIKKGDELFLNYDFNPDGFQTSKQLNIEPIEERCEVTNINNGKLKYKIVC
jgi:SET domain-containing protein